MTYHIRIHVPRTRFPVLDEMVYLDIYIYIFG